MNYDLMTIWNNHSETVEDFIETIESTINAALVGTTVRHLLAASTDIDARELVATSTQTPVELLRMLSVDEDADVRIAVAENKATPGDILSVLAHDEEVDVRVAVAYAAVHSDIARVLAHDEEEDVRSAIALNHYLDEQSRIMLTFDEDEGIRNNSTLMLFMHGESPAAIEALTRLSTDKWATVRAAVAANHTTPNDILERLAVDAEESVVKMATNTLAAKSAG